MGTWQLLAPSSLPPLLKEAITQTVYTGSGGKGLLSRLSILALTPAPNLTLRSSQGSDHL